MTVQLTFAFIAGAVATANPCGFGLLLAFLARQLGDEGAQAVPGAQRLTRALTIGALTTAGFVIVFGVVGAAISLTGSWLIAVVPWAGLVVGAGLIATGLIVLTGRHVGGGRLARLGAGGGSGSVLAFGIAYGVCSIACTLPIFLLIAGLSLAGGPLARPLTFIAYAAGMGLVLTALALAVALARGGLARVIRRLLPYFTRISGALLVLAGAYVVYYWAFALGQLPVGTVWSTPLDTVSGLSSSAQTWLSGSTGFSVLTWMLIVLVSLLAGIVVWTVSGRWSPQDAQPDRSAPNPVTDAVPPTHGPSGPGHATADTSERIRTR